MILKESEIDQDNIESILGKPYKEPGKWLTVTGSSYYFIKELKNTHGEEVLIWEDSKGIFQRYEKGLALLVNRSNYQRAILITEESILGLNLRIEKKGNTKETVLELVTEDYKGTFVTSYSSYKSQHKYFEKMGLKID